MTAPPAARHPLRTPRRCVFTAALLALAACRRAPAGDTAPAATHAPRVAPGDARAATPADTAPAATAASSDAAGPDAAPSTGAADPALFALADQVAGAVSAARGLAVQRAIAKGVLDRAGIVARLRARVREEYGPGEVALEAEIIRRLGLIPERMDYEATVFDLLEEQVAGFYDPSLRRLYLASWLPREVQVATLSHELVHALQDQHFDIGRFTHHVRGGGDAQTAAMAVVEGDATMTILEMAYGMRGQSLRDPNGEDPDQIFRANVMDLSGQPRLQAAPRALREILLFPYRAGFALCTQRFRAGGYAAIDALLRTPPVSTEQVLHPDKLASREAPINVPAATPAPLASDHRLAFDDVMGELGARLYLQSGAVDGTPGVAGAAGWGGDRAMLFVPRGAGDGANDAGVAPAALAASTLVWTLVFDAGTTARGGVDAEAQEFERVAIATLARRYASAPARVIAGATRAVESAPGRVALLARRGRVVVVLDRAPADRAEAIAASALTQGAAALTAR